MSVTLETTTDPRVAVLRGVDTDAALRHLGRSLLAGAAFSDRRILVIDLGGCEPSAPTADLLREASRVRLRGHQVIASAPTARDVPATVARARGWLDRFDGSGPDLPAAVARDVASLRSLAGTGISIAAGALRRVVGHLPTL